MAYSFTEPGPEDDDDEEDEVPHTPVMVPMADVLNHVARSNAHLSFYAESLKMEATRPILKVSGPESESNFIYMLSLGLTTVQFTILLFDTLFLG